MSNEGKNHRLYFLYGWDSCQRGNGDLLPGTFGGTFGADPVFYAWEADPSFSHYPFCCPDFCNIPGIVCFLFHGTYDSVSGAAGTSGSLYFSLLPFGEWGTENVPPIWFVAQKDKKSYWQIEWNATE